MARASRRRLIDAPVDRVWEVVSDPHHLPRWWPRTQRVENVRGSEGERRSQWTQVLATKKGRGVRADFRCISSARHERCVWEQQVAETPFERVLKSAVVEIGLEPRESGTEVRITSRQRLRGMSRLGSPWMGRATGRTLEQALHGLDEALTGAA